MTDLWVKKLCFAYRAADGTMAQILRDVSFQIGRGECVGVIGANGAGKSTLFRILTGLLPDYTGEVQVCALPVRRENLREVRRHLGYVFQESENQLFLSSVRENVAFGPRNYGLGKEDTKRCVRQALEAVGAEELADRQVQRLSGGEKKLVGIAAILAMEPEVVLMDEPSVGLDPKNRRRLIQVLNGIGRTRLIASHDLDLIWDTCERVILLSEGKVVRDGLTKTLLSDKVLLEETHLELPLRLQGAALTPKRRDL